MVTFIRTNVFADPLWYDVDVLVLTIAEPGTLFVACCLVTFRPLLRHLKSNTRFARFWSIHRPVCSLGSPANTARDNLDSGYHKSKEKGVRGFVSVLLSAVSSADHTRTESTVGITLEESYSPMSDGRNNSAV